MVGLYRLDASAAEIAATFGADAGDDPWAGDYVAPGRPAPIVVRDEKSGLRSLGPMFWGVPPPPRGDRPVALVRNLDSPFWIGTLRHRELRCLVPATSFPVWSGSAGAKRQHWLSLADRLLFAIAGILRYADDLPHFALVATEANRLAARFGPAAMPLILHREDEERWLTADWKEARTLVTPFPGQLMMVADTPPI